MAGVTGTSSYDPLASEGALNSFIQRARTAGKSDDEIRAFVNAKRAERQVPPPFEPRTQPSPEQTDFNTRIADFYRKLDEDTKQGVAMAAGGFLGGAAGEAIGAGIPAAAATAPRIVRIASGIARAIPEAAGEFFGTGLGGQLTGMSPEEAAKAGGFAAAAGMAGRGIVRAGTRLAGKAAGMRPETVKAGIENPRLLNAPEPDAELMMARRLNAQLEQQAAEITPEHADFQAMLNAPVERRATPPVTPAESAMLRRESDVLRTAPGATDAENNIRAGQKGRAFETPPTPEELAKARGMPSGPLLKRDERVSGNDILDIFQQHVTGRDNRAARAADREVQTMALKFIKRLGQDDSMSLGELDDYIRQEFTKPLVGQYARESEAVSAQRMMDLRASLTDYLYGKVGKGAAPAQAMARKAISTREAVENVFSLGKESRPTGAAADKIRGIMGDSGEAQNNRAILKAYDEQYGTHHLDNAIRLARQREWQGASAAEAVAIDSVLQPTRPGFVKGLALPVARSGARMARVTGPLAAGAAGMVRAKSKKVKGTTQ